MKERVFPKWINVRGLCSISGLANEMLSRWEMAILNYEKATIAYKEIAAEDQVRKVSWQV